MNLVSVPRRVVMFGDRRATADSSLGEMPMERVETRNPSTLTPPVNGQPATLSEALEAGMVEVWRGPNNGAYSLLTDTGTNEVVLYGFPPASARRADPGFAGPWAPAMEPELASSERDWDKYATGTSDAAQRAFDSRVQRARVGIRVRSINDQNRARHGQPPIGGGPYKPAA